MAKKRKKTKKRSNPQGTILNSAIAIVGVLLIAFIFSFTKNVSQTRIPIEVVFSSTTEQPILAVDVYQESPIEDIKVEVLNGMGERGIANKVAIYLRRNQVDVLNADNADHHDYSNTMIIQRNENIESLKKIANAFGVDYKTSNIIHVKPDENVGVDVSIILGKDIRSFTPLAAFLNSN
ncbi:MAG: LytR C-terminal domain-containing protein [Candidatus Marinimicrobia bacterium]|nr:LytR C-terminal domain-containing protein [Candidatus Neomarinimicrobiota bacterium]MBT3496315.1 LytR C-terminal domain-containing protein [Candidatus Neomarinimicrobiota bacterium]MBT3691775.1 LytR C-terminal domain-containing protein [Candidatus Neomarinimicrobiota bacterium]MBT3732141.1 LytR C-terminal domain-containing protein [Candidatus Neomarinimicrobiota bacterium]MBT4144541.1 LytR C-terminal domain-containing protein [Candidatus Neomarinimicrobiota bacterium]